MNSTAPLKYGPNILNKENCIFVFMTRRYGCKLASVTACKYYTPMAALVTPATVNCVYSSVFEKKQVFDFFFLN